MSPANTQSVASGVAQPEEVSQQEFLQHINAMQQHYRAIDPTVGQSITAYLLPAHLTMALPHAPADAATDAVTRSAAPQALQSHGLSAPKESGERTAPMLARLVTIGTPAPAAQLMSVALEDQYQKLRALVDHHRDALLHAVAAARDPKSTQTFVQQMNAM